MKKFPITCLLALSTTLLGLISTTASAWVAPKNGLSEVTHEQVNLQGGFWGPRLEIQNRVTIPHALDALERDGHITNFDKAAKKSDGKVQGHHAYDSDLYKAMEGAMASLQHIPDPALRQRVDGILNRILPAQQDDGFLITWFILNGLDRKWDKMRTEHQMYNAGHFFEMAVESDRLGGNAATLNAAKKFADHIDGIFGPGKRYDVGGHEEIELALIKLYRTTGEKRYLDLCRFLLDERGHAHGTERKPFTPGPLVLPERIEGQSDSEFTLAQRMAKLNWRNGRMQDHKPLVEQTEAVGHAVRAGYIYSAMADIARFSDAPDYEKAVEKLWQDVVSRKMYLNGGIGTAQYGDEGFGDPYLLPNQTYCESCSSIAHVFWQHRMNLLTGEAKYADVMELVLYNAALSGMSLRGDGFFYQNPLESKNGAQRSPWIGLACCPTNLARFQPQVGGFFYAHSGNRLYVNLYGAGDATTSMDDGTVVKLVQDTNYPWDGKIKLTVAPQKPLDFDLCIRIPGWALGKPVPSDLYHFDKAESAPVNLTVNGKPAEATPGADGYAHLKRSWKSGDVVELHLPMPVRRVHANEQVLADLGKVALMRGPVVYCLEGVDNKDTALFNVSLPRTSELNDEYRTDLLGGVTVIDGKGLDEKGKSVELKAIPYYSWANRDKGPMTLWINETQD